MARIYLKNKPFLISNVNLGGFEHSLVIRGENMQFTVLDIPTKTGTPYNYNWFQKTLAGVNIQTGAGTLASNSTTSQYLDIPLGLTAFPIIPGNDFIFTFQITDGVTTQELINVRFEVASDSTAPTSPDILINVDQRDVVFESLTTQQASDFNGAGLDIGYNIDLSRFVLWTVNGEEQPITDLQAVNPNKIKTSSTNTQLFAGDRVRFIFFNT